MLGAILSGITMDSQSHKWVMWERSSLRFHNLEGLGGRVGVQDKEDLGGTLQILCAPYFNKHLYQPP